MYALAVRLLGGRTAADDAVQDAWVRAIRRIEQFRWESALRTWLCGFVVNCCRERWREPLTEPLDPGSVTTVHPPAIDLERAIASLAPGYRAVLILHDVEGYTHDEIGRLLAIDPGTSKSQLSRARAAIRMRLGVEGEV